MNGKKVAIYARCSTNEARQDVQSQVEACTRYCESQGWEYEVFTEYETAYRMKKRPVFEAMLERIRLKEFNVLLVFMLDRFSRARPTQIISDFNKIVEIYKCRFIALRESLDSEQPLFEIVLMCLSWMAHNYSKMLGVRVKEGIASKKRRGIYHGGRPEKGADLPRLREIRSQGNLSLRKLALAYNKDLPKAARLSHQKIRRILPSL